VPYFVTNDNPDCSGWAVEKDDGEVIGCHRTRREAIDQMVAVSLAEEIEPGGERTAKAVPEDRRPPQGAREEAERGLEWRREYGRGGTPVGVARARDIANGENLSVDTLRRMVSYFARHEVDKQGQGWSPDEDGYPSAGRIAWALWGGDPGRTWAERLVAQIDADESSVSDNSAKRGTRPAVKVLRKSAPARFEVKAASDDAPHGEVTALVSVFGNTDLVGDRVMPGAFADSLKEIADAGRSIPFIWSHDWGRPESFLGVVRDAKETDEGLVVRASLFDTPTAQHVRQLLAEGAVSEFSFAYDVIDAAPGKDGVNELRKLAILEAGPTLKGANPATQLVGVRSALLATKAEAGELALGDFVTFEGGEGRVEYIMTEGEFGIEGDPLSLPASADDPLAMVRVYQDADGESMATDMFRGFRFSELTKYDEENETEDAEEVEEAATGAREKAQAGGTRHKVGRTLSAKNEERIRNANELLGEVLGSIQSNTTGEPVKAEEPVTVKVEEPGLSGDVARYLLDLAEIES
jgi:HK97 family phage prohead protease